MDLIGEHPHCQPMASRSDEPIRRLRHAPRLMCDPIKATSRPTYHRPKGKMLTGDRPEQWVYAVLLLFMSRTIWPI